MNDRMHPKRATDINRGAILILAAIIVFGVMLSLGAVIHAHRHLHDKLLFQTRLTAEALNLERVLTLLTKPSDSDSFMFVHDRVKQQLAKTKVSYPSCRAIYLVGRRTDGSMVSLITVGSTATPGEALNRPDSVEIPTETAQVFRDRLPVLFRPSSDSSRSVIRALAPVIDQNTGKMVAVLGADYNADSSQWIKSALPFLLLTITFAALISICSVSRIYMIRRYGASPKKMRYLGPALTVAVLGLFLTIGLCLIADEKEKDTRSRAFQQLALDKTAAVAKTIFTLRDIELEGIKRFFESSEHVNPSEFKEYTGYLLKNPAIHVWGFCRLVATADKSDIEQKARKEGLPGFRIWQLAANGKHTPATKRNVYIPVMQITPISKASDMLGYDLGSDPSIRSALNKAVRNGLPTYTHPITRMQKTNEQTTLLFYMPAFRPKMPIEPNGFALAEVQLQDLLKSAAPEGTVTLTLATGDPAHIIAALGIPPSDYAQPADPGLSVTRPIFAFGEVFFANTHAGPKFLRLFPSRAWWLAALFGLLLTASLTLLTVAVYRKREQLQELVAERTIELSEAKDRTELAIDGAQLGTWDWDLTTNRITFNENWAAMLGRDPKDLSYDVADTVLFVHPDDRPSTEEIITRHTEGRSLYIESEHRLQHQDGHYVWVIAKGRAIKWDHSGKPIRFCGTYLDTTERKRQEADHKALEDQLTQALKMEAIGRLAGGVAHDLNNMLSPIIGYSELLLDDLMEGEKHYKAVDAILSAGLRARDLVRQLLAFSRKQALLVKPVDINNTIKDFEGLLRRTIPENIEIALSLSPHLQTVMADTRQIEQVILNLSVNSADAMPDGGLLTIETAMTELDEDYAAQHLTVNPGTYVMLTVSDTGCGMDETTRSMIFEPFFSTKGELGTGLGLATVFGIVKQHGGNINVYSEPGIGSTFRIYLPASMEAPVIEKDSPDITRDLTGTETILLVEDNDMVRDLTEGILKRQGYIILPAESGEKALEVSTIYNRPIHLLLTDVIMPGMNGRKLYMEMLRDRTDIKVLYMSGYTDNTIVHHGVLDPGTAFIQKPFTLQALITKVRDVIDQTDKAEAEP